MATKRQTKALVVAGCPVRYAATTTIKLNLVPGGSMVHRKVPGGIEFDVSEAQLRYLTVCLDLARSFNDEWLEYETKTLREHHACPERDHWYRDPAIAKETDRRNAELGRKLDAMRATREADEAARAKRLGL